MKELLKTSKENSKPQKISKRTSMCVRPFEPHRQDACLPANMGSRQGTTVKLLKRIRVTVQFREDGTTSVA